MELARALALIEIAAADYLSDLKTQAAEEGSGFDVVALTSGLRALASERGVAFISFVRHAIYLSNHCALMSLVLFQSLIFLS